MYPRIEWSLFGNAISLQTYFLFAIIAMSVGLLVMLMIFPAIGYKRYEITIIFFGSALFFLIGARLLNYGINRQQYLEEGYGLFTWSFGHFSVYGGMILAGLPVLLLMKIFKKDFWLFADTIVFPFLMSFAIMRVGCFLNGCCYGKACDNFLGVPAPMAKVEVYETLNKFVPLIKQTAGPVYPTQLIEMGFALLFIPVAAILYQKHKGKGYVISLLVVYFSGFRLLVMFFRALPYSQLVTSVVYPLLYSACMLIGIILLMYKIKTSEKR